MRSMRNIFTHSRCWMVQREKTNIWVRGQVGVKEEEGLLYFVKTRKLTVTVIGKEDQRVWYLTASKENNQE